MVYTKTYIFNHFYYQYLVLLTMVPRNRQRSLGIPSGLESCFFGGSTRNKSSVIFAEVERKRLCL